MITLPNTPISEYIPITEEPIACIRISTPNAPIIRSLHIQIVWGTGERVRVPSQEHRSPGVDVTGWSRRADTEIRVPYLPADTSIEDIERWVSEVGWVLGAGYMYRWFHGPSKTRPDHAFGGARWTSLGEENAIGDEDTDLAEDAVESGYWEWEINATYRKAESYTSVLMDSWRRHDPTLAEDGSRLGPFPGWDGGHPYLTTGERNTGYESHYFFAMPRDYHPSGDVLPRGANKNKKYWGW